MAENTAPHGEQVVPAYMDPDEKTQHSVSAARPLPVTLTSGGANPAGPTGSAVPADAEYEGINVGGTLRGATGVNPTGSQYATDVNLASLAGTSLAAPDASGYQITDPMKLDPTNDGIGASKVNTQSVAVTTSGAGYVASDVVGGIISLATVNFATTRRVTLRSVQVNDKNGNAIGLNIYFFKATPASGTYTDNGNISWGTGDSANKVGQVKIAASDWLTDNSQSSVNVGNLNEKMSVSATTLFMLIVAQGGATFTNGNLTMELNFDQE